jgi:glycosyltransferase involved in cell wall biosynthesis
MMVSDQDMLKAGNQVLYRTIEGYLEHGFYVTFVTNDKDDPNVANSEELFPEYGDAFELVRFKISAHKWRQRLIGKGWLRRLQRVKRRISPEKETVSVPYPPDPDVTFPFSAGLPDQSSMSVRFLTSVFRRGALAACERVNEARPVDIVYGFETAAIPVARKVATRLNLPLVTRFQGSFLWQALLDGTAGKMYPLHVEGTRADAELLVMSNDGTRGAEVLDALGHSPDRVQFLLDGVRKDVYSPGKPDENIWEPFGIPPGENVRVILTLSKLGQWKRHDRIIGAMPLILEKYPDAYLVITHRGEMRHRLEQYATDLDLGDHVVFTGPLAHEQIDAVLNACDVYVNCSDHSNLAHPVLEAMICGRAVVAMNDGSLDGVIDDGTTGLLASLDGATRNIADAVIGLVSDDARRKSIGEEARRFAVESFMDWGDRMSEECDRVDALLSHAQKGQDIAKPAGRR